MYEVDLTVGRIVLGEQEGNIEGVKVDERVGFQEGMQLGISEGFSVGHMVGRKVGEFVGILDGDRDGAMVMLLLTKMIVHRNNISSISIIEVR